MENKVTFPVIVVNDNAFYIINREDAKEYPKELIESCAPYTDYADKLKTTYKHLEEQRDILVDNHNEKIKSYEHRIKTLEQKIDALVEENKEIKNTKDDILVKYYSIRNIIAYGVALGYPINYSMICQNVINDDPIVSFNSSFNTVYANFVDKCIICENGDIAKKVLKKLCTGDILFVEAIKKYATNHSDFPEIFETSNKKGTDESIISNTGSDFDIDKEKHSTNGR